MVSFPKISPNLLLGVGGIIAAVFLVSQIRKAGADVQDALTGLELPDINLPDINLPEIKLPEFPTIDTSGFDAFLSSITNIFKQQQDTLSSIAGQTIPSGDTGTTITIPADTTIDPETGIVTSETPPLLDLSDVEREEALRQLEINRQRAIAEQALSEIPVSEDISGAEFATAINEAEFIKRQQEQIQQAVTPTPEIISQLPDEQIFGSGGPSFIGGTIRENPIDTLQEAIALGLTASQAADFLAATGGVITPSQIEQGIIDPDIRNIVAGFIGEGEAQAFPVSSTPLETLSIRESENIKAAEFTCREFGFNCELVDGGIA